MTYPFYGTEDYDQMLQERRGDFGFDQTQMIDVTVVVPMDGGEFRSVIPVNAAVSRHEIEPLVLEIVRQDILDRYSDLDSSAVDSAFENRSVAWGIPVDFLDLQEADDDVRSER